MVNLGLAITDVVLASTEYHNIQQVMVLLIFIFDVFLFVCIVYDTLALIYQESNTTSQGVAINGNANVNNAAAAPVPAQAAPLPALAA